MARKRSKSLDNTDNLSSRIRELRTKHNLTQTELGEEIGYKADSISNWERFSDKTPNIDTLRKLKEFFGVSWDHLLDGKEETETEVNIRDLTYPSYTKDRIQLYGNLTITRNIIKDFFGTPYQSHPSPLDEIASILCEIKEQTHYERLRATEIDANNIYPEDYSEYGFKGPLFLSLLLKEKLNIWADSLILSIANSTTETDVKECKRFLTLKDDIQSLIDIDHLEGFEENIKKSLDYLIDYDFDNILHNYLVRLTHNVYADKINIDKDYEAIGNYVYSILKGKSNLKPLFKNDLLELEKSLDDESFNDRLLEMGMSWQKLQSLYAESVTMVENLRDKHYNSLSDSQKESVDSLYLQLDDINTEIIPFSVRTSNKETEPQSLKEEYDLIFNKSRIIYSELKKISSDVTTIKGKENK